jgi:hypothetical protein
MWFKCSYKDNKNLRINAQVDAVNSDEALDEFIKILLENKVKEFKGNITIKNITETKNKNKKGNLWKN